MDTMVLLAQGFIGMFNKGGETFVGWVGGIIPTLICLLDNYSSQLRRENNVLCSLLQLRCTRNGIFTPIIVNWNAQSK